MLSKIWFIREYDHKYYYKKSWWISIRMLIKGSIKKAILYLWEKDEIVFKNIPIINNTILVIYSIYTYFLCSSTYCSM